jgi:hypothetical protein
MDFCSKLMRMAREDLPLEVVLRSSNFIHILVFVQVDGNNGDSSVTDSSRHYHLLLKIISMQITETFTRISEPTIFRSTFSCYLSLQNEVTRGYNCCRDILRLKG